MRKLISKLGTIRYYNDNGNLHRDDGPAEEYLDGEKRWYNNGIPHREDGPAVEYVDGTKFWYKNGKYHREDGPAIEWSDGNKQYFYEGKLIKDCYSDEYLKKWIKLRAFR
jgi:hypothetical protein